MPTLFSCLPRLLLVFRQLQQYFSTVRFCFLDIKGTPPPDTALRTVRLSHIVHNLSISQWGSPSASDPRAKNTGQRATKGTVLTSQSLSPWCDCRRLGSTLASWRWQGINVGNPLWRRALLLLGLSTEKWDSAKHFGAGTRLSASEKADQECIQTQPRLHISLAVWQAEKGL